MGINSNPPSATLLYHFERAQTSAGRGPRGPWVYALYEAEVLPGQFQTPSDALAFPIPGLPQYGDLWETSGPFAVPCSNLQLHRVLGPTRFIVEAQFGFALGGGGPPRIYKTTIEDQVERFQIPRWQLSTLGDNIWIPSPVDHLRVVVNTTFYGRLDQNQVNLVADDVRTFSGGIRQIRNVWHVFLGAQVWTDQQNISRYAAKFQTTGPVKGQDFGSTLWNTTPPLGPLEEYHVQLPDGLGDPVVEVRTATDRFPIIPVEELQWIEDL